MKCYTDNAIIIILFLITEITNNPMFGYITSNGKCSGCIN